MRHVCRSHLTKIVIQQHITLLFVQSLVDGKVAQIKEDIAHSSILPIEYPDVRTIIQKIAGQQVIVTRPWLPQRTQSVFNLCHQSKDPRQRIGKGYTAFKRKLMIAAHRLKRREETRKSRA